MARPSIVDLDTWGVTTWSEVRGDRQPVRRYTARIVIAATANHAGLEVPTAIRCRRRPDRFSCGGHLVVRRQDLPEVIHWWCDRCDDGGAVHNWRRKPLDVGAPHVAEPQIEIELPEHVYRVLERTEFEGPAHRVVLGAWLEDEQVLLRGAPDDLQVLRWSVLAAAREVPFGSYARHYQHAAAVLRRELSSYRPVRA